MKKIFTLILMALLSGTVFSQDAPWIMSYQAIVRNSSNQLLQNTQVGVRISILGGIPNGDTLYAETHTSTTNINGLLELGIGAGAQVFGWFPYEFIPWGSGPYYIKTEIDPQGGSNYTISSTSKMMSVPHSNFAHWSGALVGETVHYIGTYRSINYNNLLCSISHVSYNRLMVTFNTSPMILIGEASPTMITFPAQWIMGEDESGPTVCTYSGTILLNSNVITVSLTEDCGGGPSTQTTDWVRF